MDIKELSRQINKLRQRLDALESRYENDIERIQIISFLHTAQIYERLGDEITPELFEDLAGQFDIDLEALAESLEDFMREWKEPAKVISIVDKIKKRKSDG